MPLYKRQIRDGSFKFVPGRTIDQFSPVDIFNIKTAFLSQDDVTFKRISITSNINPAAIQLPVPTLLSEYPGNTDTNLDGCIVCITLTRKVFGGIMGTVQISAGYVPGPGPGGLVTNNIIDRPGYLPPTNVTQITEEIWLGCELNEWKVVNPPMQEATGPKYARYRETEIIRPPPFLKWTDYWNSQYGGMGYVQLFPVPLSYVSPGVYTDPGTQFARAIPGIGFFDNPAHTLNLSNFSFTNLKQPFFITEWGFNTPGTAVNYPGYPQFSTKCLADESRVRQGALSFRSNPSSVAEVAYFRILQDVSFKLGICVDAVNDSTYVPDRILLYESQSALQGFPSQSSLTATSPLITKDGSPKLVVFEINAKAKDTWRVQFISSAPNTVMAVSLFTFDISFII
jgi:hypothetical protein